MRRFATMGDSAGGVAQASANAAAYVAATQPLVDQAYAYAQQASASATSAAASADAAAQSLIQLQAQILLPTISSDVSNELTYNNPVINMHYVGPMAVPATQAAAVAGTKAMANQLTLEYQAGTITLAQLNTALAQLTSAANSPG